MHSEPLGLLFKERLRGFKEPTSTVSIHEIMFSIYSFSLRSESSFKEPKVAQELKTALDTKNRTTTGHSDTVRRTCARSWEVEHSVGRHTCKKTAICGLACGHRLNEWILFKVQSISSRLSYLRERTEKIKGSWSAFVMTSLTAVKISQIYIYKKNTSRGLLKAKVWHLTCIASPHTCVTSFNESKQ